ncbi:hypothetical protein N7450_011763 [Penicillium hetheringtonii]|uniref:Myb-like domain-containing protein n=1 Tax=Penicillium hetheringtonii TaxID=911720 RepID=A0AAD6DAJ1_9EURO|nr:hypothetical protein N7450_011763 [Penicillium hetheringtonii]
MSNEIFRVGFSRPWKPVENPSRLRQGCLPPRRYPSPVSLDATPSPSNSKDLVFNSQVTCAPKHDRHPLPARPPIEVCVDGSSQSVEQATRQPDSVDRMSPINQNSGDLGFEDLFDYESALGSEQIDDILSNSCESLDQPTNVEICDQTFFCRPDPMPQSMSFSPTSSSGPGDSSSDQTVDPSLLAVHELRDCEREHTPKITRACPASAEVYRKSESLSSEDDASCRDRQQNSPKVRTPSRRSSRIQKVSVVIDNRHRNRGGKSIRGPDLQKDSLSTMLAQFSAFTAEERLQFLSWLFENALTRCLPRTEEIPGPLPNQDVSSPRTKRAPSGPCSSRKQQRYSAEEDRLLIQLKSEGLVWQEVIRRFDEYFPGEVLSLSRRTGIQSYPSKGCPEREL